MSANCKNHLCKLCFLSPERRAKKAGSTFKHALRKLKRGDAIEITGVDGDFIVNDPRKE